MAEELLIKNDRKIPKGLVKLGAITLVAAAAVGVLGKVTEVKTPGAGAVHVVLPRNPATFSEQQILAAASKAAINTDNRLAHGQPIHFLGGLADVVIDQDNQVMADYQIADPLAEIQNGVSLIGYIDYETSRQTGKPQVHFVNANNVVGWSNSSNDPVSIQAGKQYEAAFDSETTAGNYDLSQPNRPDGQPLTSPYGVPMSIGFRYGLAESDSSAI